MRWIDKPRYKTTREIVLEYIKFLKIMGFYHILVKDIYDFAKQNYRIMVYDNGKRKTCYGNSLMHKENAIKRLQVCICHYKRFDRMAMYYLTLNLFSAYGELKFKDRKDLEALLWSYFKDVHVANCFISDSIKM